MTAILMSGLSRAAEAITPAVAERWEALRGDIVVTIDGVETLLRPGRVIDVAAGAEVRVERVSDALAGITRRPVMPVAAPGRPGVIGEGMAALSVTDGNLTLTVLRLPANGGAEISGIDLRVGDAAPVALPATLGAHDLGAVDPEAVPAVRVAARNAVGLGPWSDPVGQADAPPVEPVGPTVLASWDWSATTTAGEIVISILSAPPAGARAVYVIAGVARLLALDPVQGGSYAVTEGITAGQVQSVQVAWAIGPDTGPLGAAKTVTSKAEETGGGEQPVEVLTPALYPAVAPVSLTAAGGSLKFPEGNWNAQTARDGLKAYKGLLYQDRAGLSIAASGTPQATFAIIRLPVDKRDSTYMRGVFGHSGTGGNALRLAFVNPGNSVTAERSRFKGYQRGAGGGLAQPLSPVWDEDAALVVMHHDGVDQWALDWYSLIDGTRHAGDPFTGTVNAPSAGMSGFNIGGIGTVSTLATDANAATDMLWDGEIAAVGYLSGAAVSPADWARIAMGAPLSEVLPVSAVKWVREFDGTEASLARPAWATADATGPTIAVPDSSPSMGGTMLGPGSAYRRQSEGQFVTFDSISAGRVYALKHGATTADVPLSGRASGPVEVRVFEAATGAVVADWTAFPAPVNGVWAAKLRLPESTNGWLFADVRLIATPSVRAQMRSEFGVGYKFMVMGQSQTAIPMANMTTRLALEPGTAMSASVAQLMYLGKRAELGADARRPVLGRIGTGVGFAPSDGLVSFLNQFRRLKPKTPVMVVNETVSGTSMRVLLEGGVDADNDRQWADITDKLVLWGRDYTAILWNWLMNEGSPSGVNVTPLMAAMFLPANASDMTHSLVTELEPGWTLGVIGGDRESRINDRDGMRAARIAFAHDNGFTVGPAVSDYRIENAGGPHPGKQFNAPGVGYTPPEVFEHGNARFMQRMAVMALQIAGVVSEPVPHPYLANARLSGDGKIYVDAVAVNGGTIYSPAPAALRSWYVKEPGEPYFTSLTEKGGTAVLNTSVSPPRAEISRASGAWAAGTVIRRMDDSEKRADNDGAAEDAIHAGGIYETWAHDPLGFGFPVVGMRDAGGKWRILFEQSV
ncbi:hypothetical protein [Haematobacter massiliensis]|uniref:hypothetical protein n=1 Tax=Haematobacter massiliensis TaxID=195105 RepID=UPI0023F30759|nr:hypothetical protein [Haematobacter massiliensis]